MTLKNGIFACFVFLCQLVSGQRDSITALEEVLVADTQLANFSKSQSVLILNDSVIGKNSLSLTDLLRYNSVVYFKENGPGMVSSPSFRGTTAQQTAVIWNGLNVNSAFNGQTDFNAIATRNFNSVSIRAGGGSVIYGSSAIGGSVHLNNELVFGNRFNNQLEMLAGSFATYGLNYRIDAATDQIAIQAGIVRNSSDNDFKIIGTDRRNTNGQYENTAFNLGFAFRMNPVHTIGFYSYVFDGARNFSLISPTETKTGYRDFNTRNLLEWTARSGKLVSTAKLALLNEKYEYFANLSSGASNFGEVKTALAKYDVNYRLSDKIRINAVAEHTQTSGRGSDIEKPRREISSLAVLLRHRAGRKFAYELGARKEITDSYQSPFLFSAGAGYDLGKHYTIKINGSKNFRIPTFNDLYWSDGGNPDLKPESSLQLEIGNEFRYDGLFLSITGYYIDIKNMIQWLPGTTALWHPVNGRKVESYGLEAILGWDKKIGNHRFNASGTYAYTLSKNKETGYYLIYVPQHKATAALAYALKGLTLDAQWLFTGEVFTRSDNNPRYNIDAYSVANFGAGYAIGKTPGIKIGARILNAFDQNYQVVAGRPFPGRNFNLYLNLNF